MVVVFMVGLVLVLLGLCYLVSWLVVCLCLWLVGCFCFGLVD